MNSKYTNIDNEQTQGTHCPVVNIINNDNVVEINPTKKTKKSEIGKCMCALYTMLFITFFAIICVGTWVESSYIMVFISISQKFLGCD